MQSLTEQYSNGTGRRMKRNRRQRKHLPLMDLWSSRKVERRRMKDEGDCIIWGEQGRNHKITSFPLSHKSFHCHPLNDQTIASTMNRWDPFPNKRLKMKREGKTVLALEMNNKWIKSGHKQITPATEVQVNLNLPSAFKLIAHGSANTSYFIPQTLYRHPQWSQKASSTLKCIRWMHPKPGWLFDFISLTSVRGGKVDHNRHNRAIIFFSLPRFSLLFTNCKFTQQTAQPASVGGWFVQLWMHAFTRRTRVMHR